MFRRTLIASGLLLAASAHAATPAAPAAAAPTAATASVSATPAVTVPVADLDALRAELARQRALIDEQQARLDALADTLEQQPAAANPLAGTTIGMYGEVHYNHLRADAAATGRDNLHLHRFVVLLGHRFSDDVKFYSELEFEGAPDSNEVETEVEQFFVNLRLGEDYSLDIGQFLLPVGLLNETHEPNAFYGVERNPVEEFIIPATWWEKGVMLHASPLPGVSADLAVHNGLRGDLFTLGSADGLREFRQEFGGARAGDLAYTLRLKYTGLNGLELGAAAQRQGNITQSADPLVGGKAPAMLYTAHADWHWKGLGLRGLVARWDIDNAVAASNGTDVLEGWYVEPSWRASEKLGVFARYNDWNTAANQAGSDGVVQVNAGISWFVVPQVVLKADLQARDLPGRQGDGFNLGMGLSF